MKMTRFEDYDDRAGDKGVSFRLDVAGYKITDEDGNEVKIVTEYKVTNLHFDDEADIVMCKNRFEKSLAYDLAQYQK